MYLTFKILYIRAVLDLEDGREMSVKKWINLIKWSAHFVRIYSSQ